MAINQILSVPDWRKLSTFTGSTPPGGFSQIYPGPNQYWYVQESSGLVKRLAYDNQFYNGLTTVFAPTESFVDKRIDVSISSGLSFSYDGPGSSIFVTGLTTGNLSIIGSFTQGYVLSAATSGDFEWIAVGSASVQGTSGSVAKFTSSSSVGDSGMIEVISGTPGDPRASLYVGMNFPTNLGGNGSTKATVAFGVSPSMYVDRNIHFGDNSNRYIGLTNSTDIEISTTGDFLVSAHPLLPGTDSKAKFIDAQTDFSTHSSIGHDRHIEFLSGLVSVNQRSNYPPLFIEPTSTNSTGVTPSSLIRTPSFGFTSGAPFLNYLTGTFGVALGLSGGGIQIKDGTEGQYRVLVSSTTQGHGIWATMVEPGPRWRLPLYQSNGNFALGASQSWRDSYNYPFSGGTPIVRTFSTSIELALQNWTFYVTASSNYDVNLAIPNMGGPTATFLMSRNQKDIFGPVYLYDEVETFGSKDTIGKVDSFDRYSGFNRTPIGTVPGLYYLRDEGIPSELLNSGLFFKDISNTGVNPNGLFTYGKNRRNNYISYGLGPEKTAGGAWNNRNQQLISAWHKPNGSVANIHRPSTWTMSYFVGAVNVGAGAGGVLTWSLPDGASGSGARNAFMFGDSLSYLAFSGYNYFPRAVVQDSILFYQNTTQSFPYRSLADVGDGDKNLSWGQPDAWVGGSGPNSVRQISNPAYTGPGYGHDMYLGRAKSTILGQDFMNDRAMNFLMDYQNSRLIHTGSYTEFDTILHKMIKGESGEYNANLTQSTGLFVVNQIGSWQDSGAFVTASRLVGIQVAQALGIQYRKPNAWAREAYDFYSSRIANGNIESNIESHVGFFAQSKLNGQMWDPMGRRIFAYGARPVYRNPADLNIGGLGPISWPTYSIYNTNKPWGFFAEKDKSNLGGGLLIDMGATFGTPLRASIEIEAVTRSRSFGTLPFTVSSTVSVFQRDGSYITYPFAGVSYSTFSSTLPQLLLRPGVTPSQIPDGSLWYTPGNLSFVDSGITYNLLTTNTTTVFATGLTGFGVNNYVPVWNGVSSLKATSSIYISNSGNGNVGIGVIVPDYSLQVATTSLSPTIALGLSGSILYQDGSQGKTGSVMMADADGKTNLYDLILPAPGYTSSSNTPLAYVIDRRGPTMGSGYMPLYVGKGNSNGPSGYSEYQLGPNLINSNGSTTSVLVQDQPFGTVFTIPTISEGKVVNEFVMAAGNSNILGRKWFKTLVTIDLGKTNDSFYNGFQLNLEEYNNSTGGTNHYLKYIGGAKPFRRNTLTVDYNRSILTALVPSAVVGWTFYSSAAVSDSLSPQYGAYANQRTSSTTNALLRNGFVAIDGQIGRYTESVLANNYLRDQKLFFLYLPPGATQFLNYDVSNNNALPLSTPLQILANDKLAFSSEYSVVEVSLASYNANLTASIGGLTYSPGYSEYGGLTAGLHYFITSPNPVAKAIVNVTPYRVDIPNFIGEFDYTKVSSTSSNLNRLNTYIGTYKRMEFGYSLNSPSATDYVVLDSGLGGYIFSTSSINLMTGLFVNNQIGGLTWSFASATHSIGVYSRQDVDNGRIINAYDFYSSRMSSTYTQSRIDNHIGFYAQSKIYGTTSLDPTGRIKYDYRNRMAWPATFSFDNLPWAFYAEGDKSNFGGGVLIDGSATFGTSLNAWLKIQGASTSNNWPQIILEPGITPTSPVTGSLWYHPYTQSGVAGWTGGLYFRHNNLTYNLLQGGGGGGGVGPQGPAGPAGSAGTNGSQGPTGSQGTTGSQGRTGATGIASVGPFSANNFYPFGATLSSGVLTLGAAGPSNPGLVHTSTQTFSGDKYFNGDVFVGPTNTNGLFLFDGSGITYSGFIGPTRSSSNLIYRLPPVATVGRYLKIDNQSGDVYELSWATAAGGGPGGLLPATEIGFGDGSAIVSSANFRFWSTGLNLLAAESSNLQAPTSNFCNNVIIGGKGHTMSNVCQSIILGGLESSMIGGDGGDSANSIIGSYGSCITGTGSRSSIIGGYRNIITATGPGNGAGTNTIIGGSCNTVTTGGGLAVLRNGLFSTNNSTVRNVTSNSVILGGSSHLIGDNSSCSAILSGLDSGVYSGCASSIVGGQKNRICNDVESSIIGGYGGGICGQSNRSSIIGGCNNQICNAPCSLITTSRLSCINPGPSTNATINSGIILSGDNNIISGSNSDFATIINGNNQCILGTNSNNSSILGGLSNKILTFSEASTIIGGNDNTIRNAPCSAIISSKSSKVCLNANATSTQTIKSNIIIGGDNNLIFGTSSEFATIINGNNQCIFGCGSNNSGIIGGSGNQIGTASNNSFIVGGQNNRLLTSPRSVIIGGDGLGLTGVSDTVLVPNLQINSVSQDDGQTALLVWNGTDKIVRWRHVNTISGGPGGSGPTVSLAGFVNGTLNGTIDLLTGGFTNGATLSYNSNKIGSLTFSAANSVNPGMVSTSTQSFKGVKTFMDDVFIGSTATNTQEGLYFYDTNTYSTTYKHTGFVAPNGNYWNRVAGNTGRGPTWSLANDFVYELPGLTGRSNQFLTIASFSTSTGSTTYSLTWTYPQVGVGLTLSDTGVIGLVNLTPNTVINVTTNVTNLNTYTVSTGDNGKLIDVRTDNQVIYVVAPTATQSYYDSNLSDRGFEFRVRKNDTGNGVVSVNLPEVGGTANSPSGFPFVHLTRQNQIYEFKYNYASQSWASYLVDMGYVGPNTLIGNLTTATGYAEEYEFVDYNDSVQKALNYTEGSFNNDWLNGVIYSSVDALNVSTSLLNNQLSLFNINSGQFVGLSPAGASGLTIPGFSLTRGKNLRVYLAGTYSKTESPAGGLAQFNLGFLLGGKTINSRTFSNDPVAPNTQARGYFEIEYNLKVRNGGLSGSVYGTGKMMFEDLSSAASPVYLLHNNYTQSLVTDINLASNATFDIRVNNPSATNLSFTVLNSIIERLA